ncbi:MAG TPA: PP2C family protein-serine/threonine phosphatase [Mycobacteriales bacterium]|nr:PP2C family protein-serine/threonine phosphatase [Mycobacteriales bacterium]
MRDPRLPLLSSLVPAAARPELEPSALPWPDAAALLPAVRELAAAATALEVADVAVRWARWLTRARGAALAVRLETHVEILASSGYDCDAFAPGARLPVTAGLPLTEAARTAAPVVRQAGDGGWIAVPLIGAPGSVGALVVSLAAAASPDDLPRLAALGADTSAALGRARRHDGALERAAAAAPLLAAGPLVAPPGVDVAARVEPIAGDLGGDLIELLPGGRGAGHWLVVADACGNGPRAAATAGALRQAVRALVPHCPEPSALLPDLDRLLTRDRLLDGFASALVLHVQRTRTGLDVAVASAGHLPPMLLAEGALAEIRASGPLLGQGLGPVAAADFPAATVHLGPGDAVVVYTDGLVDRWSGDATALVDSLLAQAAVDTAAGGCETAGRLADRLLTRLSGVVGKPRDDVAIAVIRCPA